MTFVSHTNNIKVRRKIMQLSIKEKDKALAEVFTRLLIKFLSYKNNAITKWEYEAFKDMYLYDGRVLEDIAKYRRRQPEYLLFADKNKAALDVLNNLVDAGAISVYEYETLKRRHYLN